MNPISRAGRRMAVGIAIAGAAILLPAAALAASSGGNPQAHASAAAVPKCGVATPALPGGAFVWSGNPGDGFAGGQGYEAEVTNTGHHACTLRGVPALAAVAAGHLVGSKVPGSRKGSLITLKAGATAHFGLTIFIPMCAHPVAATVEVYLPGQTKGQSAFLSAQACPGEAGGGVLRATAIQAGTGIPLYDI